jgi:hypothetical protein
VARPAIRALGQAAPVGREAVRAALPNTKELRRYAEPTPDLGRNLRITLEDFANPANAVERDPRAPGGRGFSGLEAVLAYIFNQSLTINGFDEFGHMVRAAVHTDDCSAYMDAERAKAEPELVKECNSWLGPNQPGINQPDPSPQAAAETAEAAVKARRKAADQTLVERAVLDAVGAPAPARDREAAPTRGGPALPTDSLPDAADPVTDILDFLLMP